MTTTRILEEKPSVYFESKSKNGASLDQASRHKSIFLDNGLAIFGRNDGTIQIYDLKQKKSFTTPKPLVNLDKLKKQYENAAGSAPHYCLNGFNFRATLSPHAIFLLTDFLCPEFFILNLKNLSEFQQVPFRNVTAVTTLPKGKIAVATSEGEIFISESAYKFGDKITFKLLGNHGGWINSLISLSASQLLSYSDNSTQIWDIDSKQSIKKIPMKETHCTLKTLPNQQLIVSNHNGLKILDIKKWSVHGFEGNVLDCAVHKGYLAAAILEEYKPLKINSAEVLSEEDYPAQRDEKLRGINTKIHLSKPSLIKIQIWDMESWECVCEQPFFKPLEDNISISWTPTGNLMIYEKYSTLVHHLNVIGLAPKTNSTLDQKPVLSTLFPDSKSETKSIEASQEEKKPEQTSISLNTSAG